MLFQTPSNHFFKSFVEWQNSLNKVILICRRRCYKLTKLACRASVHYFEGSSQFYGEGPFKKMTQEVVKVTGSCRLFCAFSICDSLERHNAAKTRRYACCPCLLPSFLSEGISNCFKTLEAASLFLFAIVWHHLEHERLSNFSNFCKTKACWPYFGIASKAIPYF